MKTFPPVALVTGAGSGIGRQVALGLLEAGYAVAIVGRREARLQETAALAGPRRDNVEVCPGDVTDPADVARVFGRIHARWGRIDLLFNNAGSNAPAVPFEDLSLSDWRTVVDSSLTGAFLCSREAFRLMKRQQPRGGRIINNGSISAHVPRPSSAPYAAAKHALTGLTRALSLDGRAHDIACGQIDIGNAATDMTASMAMGVLQADGTVASEPRIDVAHVVRAVLYMAGLPLDANVPFMTVMANRMPYMGRG